MNRRTFIAGLGSAAAWTVVARGQEQGERVRRMGALISYDVSDPAGEDFSFWVHGETGGVGLCETFEFIVSSKRRLTRVAAYIGQSRVCEVSSVDPPAALSYQTVQIPPDAAGLTLRIRAVDTIGNNIEEQPMIAAAPGPKMLGGCHE